MTITVTDNAGYSSTASFTWTINQAPAFTSADTTTFTAGSPGTFAVTATGTPTPALSETGTLPGGVSFTDNGGGDGTLAGTPTTGTAGTYMFTLTATSAAGVTPQSFTLTVLTTSASSVLTTSANPVGLRQSGDLDRHGERQRHARGPDRHGQLQLTPPAATTSSAAARP